MDNKAFIICDPVIFYSHKDEDVFFAWIKRWKDFQIFDTSTGMLRACLKSETMCNEDLLSALTLCYRYRIDMKQFAQFLTPENKHWFFGDKKAFWHKWVFGDAIRRCRNPF